MAHAHSHARPRGSADRAVQTDRTLRAVLLVVLAVAALSTVLGLAALWPDHGKVASASTSMQFAAKGTTFPTGKIVALANGCPGYFSPASSSASSSSGSSKDSGSAGGSSAPGDTRACQMAKVTLLNGPSSGRTVSMPLLWPYATAGLHAGDSLELMVPPQASGSTGSSRAPAGASSATAAGTEGITVNGVVRDQSLALWLFAFAIVVVAVGLLRGFMALVSLGFSALVLVEFVLPALVSGRPGLAVAVVGGSAIMFVVLYLAHGPSIRTSVALVGTLCGIAITAGIAQLAVATTHLTGVSGDVGGMLAGVTQIDFRGLLTCAIVIAGLGVLNDVTVTQASAVWELRAASPELSRRQLFAGAMRIGRDHIASTIYTIAFAYAGAAMAVLIVLSLYDRPVLTLLYQEDLAAEVVRTLCSGIGLVIAVPVTTAIAVLLVPPGGDRRTIDFRETMRLSWRTFVPHTASNPASEPGIRALT